MTIWGKLPPWDTTRKLFTKVSGAWQSCYRAWIKYNGAWRLVYGPTPFEGNTGQILLLHCDGTEGSTSFPDSSRLNMNMTANAVVDTAIKKFGTGSANFYSGIEYLWIIPDNAAAYIIYSNDFTIDLWVCFNPLHWNKYNIFMYGVSTDISPTLYWVPANEAGSNRLAMFGDWGSGNTISFVWNPDPEVWYHVAVVRKDGMVTAYIDGTSIGSEEYPYEFTYGISAIGTSGNHGMWGWMDEIRLLNGIAAWDGNFTPPSGPYT